MAELALTPLEEYSMAKVYVIHITLKYQVTDRKKEKSEAHSPFFTLYV
jgi:hypothetical protein